MRHITTALSLTLILLALTLLPYSLSNAAPFLTCDHYPTGSLLPHFIIERSWPPSTITTPAITNPDGSQIPWWDMAGTPNGTHTLRMKAVNIFGDESGWSEPFPFERAAPSSPAGQRIKLAP